MTWEEAHLLISSYGLFGWQLVYNNKLPACCFYQGWERFVCVGQLTVQPRAKQGLDTGDVRLQLWLASDLRRNTGR